MIHSLPLLDTPVLGRSHLRRSLLSGTQFFHPKYGIARSHQRECTRRRVVAYKTVNYNERELLP